MKAKESARKLPRRPSVAQKDAHRKLCAGAFHRDDSVEKAVCEALDLWIGPMKVTFAIAPKEADAQIAHLSSKGWLVRLRDR